MKANFNKGEVFVQINEFNVMSTSTCLVQLLNAIKMCFIFYQTNISDWFLECIQYVICQDVDGNDFARIYKAELNYVNNHTTLLQTCKKELHKYANLHCLRVSGVSTIMNETMEEQEKSSAKMGLESDNKDEKVTLEEEEKMRKKSNPESVSKLSTSCLEISNR